MLQFAVHPAHRRQGLGTALFSFIASETAEALSVINADERSETCAAFLPAIGLQAFISQYEMALDLTLCL